MHRIKDFFFGSIQDDGHRSAMTWFWRLVFLAPLAAILVFVALGFTNLPSVEELENPQNNEASRILAADGSVLGAISWKTG